MKPHFPAVGTAVLLSASGCSKKGGDNSPTFQFTTNYKVYTRTAVAGTFPVKL